MCLRHLIWSALVFASSVNRYWVIFPSKGNLDSITFHEGRMDSMRIWIIFHVVVDEKKNCMADVGMPLIPTLDGLGKKSL